MLSAFDDHPVHQTTDPVAEPASPDTNAFERYTFHGSGEPGVSFAATLALYPRREVVDGSFTIVRDGRQRTVRASGRLRPGDRTTSVGPLRVEVTEPLQRLRLILDDPDGDLGVEADLSFTATDVPLELPGPRPVPAHTVATFDRPQLTQWGTWTGSVRVDGETVVDTTTGGPRPGTRDRAWGARPLEGDAPGAPAHDLPQLFWLRASVALPGLHLHAAIAEDARGRRWHSEVHAVPAGGRGETWRDVHPTITWHPGTRRAAAVCLVFVPWQGEPVTVSLVPRAELVGRGLGYADPSWGHGAWKDETAVGTDTWDVVALDPTDVRHLHRFTTMTATTDTGTTDTMTPHPTTANTTADVSTPDASPSTDTTRSTVSGHALVELLAVGPHAPSGLVGFTDGFTETLSRQNTAAGRVGADPGRHDEPATVGASAAGAGR